MRNIIFVLVMAGMCALMFVVANAQEAKKGEIGGAEIKPIEKIDIALAIEKVKPGAVYYGSVTVNTKEAYEKIRWQDSEPKPSWEELKQAYVIAKQEQDAKEAMAQYKSKVDKRIREIAMRELKAEGAIPSNYTEE
ncbi:MAG: hypothetical protein PHF74_05580 [Dehalococcoidales bacterium]|nr:hypothetical protein [Dehalococcoidales bacterium]